ncbi:MAG TPA: hypothetical protein VNN76_12860 [Bacteroidota bacterium]|nr:hypothetical protein [Bacteroidota bacterium]
MLATLYVLNLVPSFVLAWGFRSALLQGFGDSMSIEALRGEFDFTVFFDFLNHHGDALTPVYAQIVVGLCLYLLISVFTTGGVLTVLNGVEGTLRNFFSACGDLFARFFRLFVTYAAVALAAGITTALFLGIVYELMTEGAESEKPEVLWLFALVGIWVAVILVISLIADYAKIDTVLNDRGKMVKAFWRSTKLVLKNFLPVIGLQVLLILLIVLLIGVYWGVERLLDTSSAWGVVLLFIIQQAFVGSRIWVRVLSFASQRELFLSAQYQATTLPEPGPPVPPPVAEPIPLKISAPRRRISKSPSRSRPRKRK